MFSKDAAKRKKSPIEKWTNHVNRNLIKENQIAKIYEIGLSFVNHQRNDNQNYKAIPLNYHRNGQKKEHENPTSEWTLMHH